jgi:acetyl-CoA C-acetyltransferase
MNAQDIVIVAAKRTPLGSLLGALSSISAPHLAASTHQACLHKLDLSPQLIDEVIMGCVLQAGIGQAPARQSLRFAGFPDSIPATTINKMCGSGMQAIMYAHDNIKAGNAILILAGGMENMSQAPYLLKKARAGYRLGHGQLLDHLFLDGLEDAYEHGKLMGYFADETAKKLGVTRQAQDEYARASMERALHAQQTHYWDDEIVPITVPGPKQTETCITQDEHPDSAKLAKMANLKPAFSPEGTVTAANASAISDGAASLLITTRAFADQHHLPILAQIQGHASFAQAPEWFTTSPAPAIQKLLTKLNWQSKDVDLFEINEAFAVVPMLAMKELDIPHDKMNINGGACALGHPIGASGARIIVTLLHALIKNNLKRGIASLCIGGGEATAIAIERETV